MSGDGVQSTHCSPISCKFKFLLVSSYSRIHKCRIKAASFEYAKICRPGRCAVWRARQRRRSRADRNGHALAVRRLGRAQGQFRRRRSAQAARPRRGNRRGHCLPRFQTRHPSSADHPFPSMAAKPPSNSNPIHHEHQNRPSRPDPTPSAQHLKGCGRGGIGGESH
jgi:hypothetical protein